MRFGAVQGHHQSQVSETGRMALKIAALVSLPLFALAAPPALRNQAPAAFTDVNEQTTAQGFRATAVYLNDADQPFGARFIHQKTGFTLDLIQVQSVPQAFTWVNSFPVSDKGEPHTQEHLLMGKGNIGRAFAASQSMTLTEATAFTMQWRTCYSFNTKAGLPVFYDEFKLRARGPASPRLHRRRDSPRSPQLRRVGESRHSPAPARREGHRLQRNDQFDE